MTGVRKKIPTTFRESQSSLWGQLRDLPRKRDVLSGQSLSCTNLAKGAVCMCLAQEVTRMVLDSALGTPFKR